jgi:carboxypeptidase family protein
MKPSRAVAVLVVLLVAALLAVGTAIAQVNAVDLAGTINDPQGHVVSDAKVTVRNLATNLSRSKQTGDDGRYLFVGLAPGRYELTVEKSGFARVVNPEVILEIGHVPEVNVQLQLQTGTQQITVTGEAEIVETQRTTVSETVGSREIENLPINGRNYVNFTLLNSQVTRDSAPSIGAAPTSGLNFGGQRARSNEVSVDGADAVDNSVNGIRSTVSQEDVQEFQLIISNYMPEFGRATGGVVNIVTKSGSNEFHGDAFGFLRDAALQARNPFSVAVNPTTGVAEPVKQAYTRAQYGTAFGGPIKKDKDFFFFSFEGTRRHETGFTDIGANGGPGSGTGPFGLVPCTACGAFFPGTLLLTPQQNSAVTSLLATNPMLAANYAIFAGSASSVALTGVDFGAVASGLTGGLYSPGPGAQFPIPVNCAPGKLVNGRACSAIGVVAPALPTSFHPLETLIGNYPIVERTDLYALRFDHIWNSKNTTFVRGNVSPSFATGIQVNAQNQSFGQNAGSRTSLQQYRDLDIVAQHDTTISSDLLNEFRFQFGRRGLHYGFSDLPGGGDAADNITGYAFTGREPFSTVDRIERRMQFTDHLSYVLGKHSLKFGADTNLIQLRSDKPQIFELNFGGLFDFGSLSASSINSAFAGLPSFAAVQAYGLGLPQDFIQGTGESNLLFDNKTLGAFVQDSWRISPRVTVNFGLRYDIEWTPIFSPFAAPPATGVNNPVALRALGVTEGIPVFDNGYQPRVGIAWDPWGDGKTVIRAGGGLFYDHPLLALAFDSTTADGARSSQLVAAIGNPSACGVFPIGYPGYTAACPSDSPANLNASSIFQGVLNSTNVPTGFPFSIPYLPNQQRFTALPTTPPSVFVNQNFMASGFPTAILPFTLPTASNFVYGYATQANLSIERDLGHGYKLSVGYVYTKGTHLYRPRNVNVANATLLDSNLLNAVAVCQTRPAACSAAGLSFSNPLLVSAPSANLAATGTACGATVLAPGALALLGGCPAGPLAGLNGQFLSTPAIFNFFRPSGPNPSFAGLTPGLAYSNTAPGTPGEVQIAALAGYPTGYNTANGAPIPIPYSDVDQQESSGSSSYNALVVNLEKRWSQNFQFLASYTYSHAIDNSTDLQTLLTPQDSNNPQLERGNSTFDQRHRFVVSGVFQSPYKWRDGGWKAFFGDWVVAPIIEASTGRPYTILTGTDYPLQFSSETSRPSVVPPGTAGGVTSPFIHGATFALPNVCPSFPAFDLPAIAAVTGTGYGCTGNLGRNTFYSPKFVSVDLRVSRKFALGERFKLEVLADMFNLLNRFNVGDVNPLCDPGSSAGGTCAAGQPTSAFDPRTFQFGLKIYW